MKEICDSIDILLNATEPKKGGLTAYTTYHILKSLSLMRERPIGRPNLERNLGIGEASARTLLRRLRELGLVRKTSNGHVLTEKGKKVIEKINNLIKIKYIGRFFGSNEGYVIIISGLRPPKNLVDVYKIRDYLVIHNCRFPLVLGGFEGKKLLLPGIPEEIILRISEMVKSLLGSVNRGVLIIINKECIEKALSASLSILKDFCQSNDNT